MAQTALILGPRGRFGRHCAQAFAAAGWDTRLFDRATDDLTTATRGVDVIVNGWNMSAEHWAKEQMPAHARVIAAAQQSGATVLLPGNIYNYGRTMPRVITTEAPHPGDTLYARIRMEIEAAYRTAGVKTILLRAGDFLDTEPSGNWFDAVLVKSLPKGVLSYPGPLDVPHAWAFLPDMARVAVALAERRETLPRFAEYAYAGLALTGREMGAALSKATGREVRVKRFWWLPVRLSQPFWPLARYLTAMRYLWEVPHGIDPAPLSALLPDHRDTPAVEALAASVQHHVHPDRVVAGQAIVAR